MYYIVLVIFLAGFLLIYRIVHSPFGQVLKAIRENEPRAISLGYDTDRYKLHGLRALGRRSPASPAPPRRIVFQLASLTDVHWTHVGRGGADDAARRPGHDLRPGGRRASSIVAMENYLAQLGAWVTVIAGRDLRRLRARVPPRHRRRARRLAGAAALILVTLAASLPALGAVAETADGMRVTGQCRSGQPQGNYALREPTAACVSRARSATGSGSDPSSSGRPRGAGSRTCRSRPTA